MITEDQYQEAAETKRKCEELISDYLRQKRKEGLERLKTNPIFTLDELRFSASGRCKCGAGLAYPKNLHGAVSHWDCADVLLGKVKAKLPHATFPFAFYEIKFSKEKLRVLSE